MTKILRTLFLLLTTSTTYNFTYDVFGNADTIGVGSVDLVDYEYNSKNGKLLYQTYANNFSVKYTYDPLDKIEKIWYNDDVSTDNSAYYIAYTYTYDTNGNIAKLTNHISNEETAFKYDTSGRPVYSCKYNLYNSDGSAYANKYSIQAAYDDKSRISVAVYSIDYPSASAYTENLQVGYHFAYDEENRLSFSYAEIIPSSMLPDYNEDEPVYMQYYTAYSYDKFNRLSGTNLSVTIDEYTPNLSVSTNYTYEVSNGQATSRVATYSTNIGGTATGYSYSYDAKGNITEIRNNSTFALIASFTYDNLNRLTRENNAQLGKTYTYTYDNAGNITSKKHTLTR